MKIENLRVEYSFFEKAIKSKVYKGGFFVAVFELDGIEQKILVDHFGLLNCKNWEYSGIDREDLVTQLNKMLSDDWIDFINFMTRQVLFGRGDFEHELIIDDIDASDLMKPFSFHKYKNKSGSVAVAFFSDCLTLYSEYILFENEQDFNNWFNENKNCVFRVLSSLLRLN